MGLILSANRLVRLVTNSLSGYMIDRFGRHWPFIGSLLLGGVTTIAYGVLSGVRTFLIARLLWGTAELFLRIEGLSTALDVETDDNRGRMMGIFNRSQVWVEPPQCWPLASLQIPVIAPSVKKYQANLGPLFAWRIQV